MESRIDFRRKDFKKCFDDPLRRREQEQVQIRKQQRDANLAKKRNQMVQADENAINMPMDIPREVPQDICRQLMDTDPKNQYAAAQAVRRLLSLETNPPIQTVINAGLVPRFVEFLRMDDKPELQFEAAWALTNIASGLSSQTYTVVNAGAIPEFVRLMDSPRLDVREQAIWALGNIAGDCGELRDQVIRAGGFAPLIRELKRAESGVDVRLSLLRYATWTLSNFCRGKTEAPMELIREALPVLRVLLQASDKEILTDACWAISYMSDTNEGTCSAVINEIIRNGVCGRLVELLSHKSFLVQTPALRAVGNIVTGDETQTQAMISYACIPKLKALLFHPHRPIRKEACWALSNITAGSREQIDEVINHGVMADIAKLLTNDEFEVKREATWCLANAASGGNARQVAAIIDAGALAPLVSVLSVNDSKVVRIALEAIENVLKTGKWRQKEENLPENPYVNKLEEAGAFPLLEKLQCLPSSSNQIQAQVLRIMTGYLDVYVENEQTAPQTGFGGMAA